MSQIIQEQCPPDVSLLLFGHFIFSHWTKVIFVLLELICQTFKSSYSPRQASNWSGVKPFAKHRCCTSGSLRWKKGIYHVKKLSCNSSALFPSIHPTYKFYDYPQFLWKQSWHLHTLKYASASTEICLINCGIVI